MLALSVALGLALFSAAVAQQGRVFLAAVTAAFSLTLAGWVAITIVPALAKRSSLKWFAYQVDYRLTREGIIYLGAVFILVLAAVNTGNNLLFMILACTPCGNFDFRSAFSRGAHWVDSEVRHARAHFRRAAGACRTRTAQRKANVAVVFPAGRGEKEKHRGAGAHAARIFSLHSAAKCRAPKSELHFPSAAFTGKTHSASAPASLSASSRKPQVHSQIEIIVYPRVARRPVLRSAPAAERRNGQLFPRPRPRIAFVADYQSTTARASSIGKSLRAPAA